jgi:hypothetical protein
MGQHIQNHGQGKAEDGRGPEREAGPVAGAPGDHPDDRQGHAADGDQR